MLVSKFFLPQIKETPKEASTASHILMLRSGMIKQVVSGIYTWLPLGLMALKNVEHIARNRLNQAGCVEMLMPCIQPASLWTESGRYDSYGAEMLRITDRHEHQMLFGPTAEELITDIFRSSIKSYKDLPKNLYQIQWKFRDEIRPRFGVMRGREFLMKDAYSFDIDKQSALNTYNLMYETYYKIFDDLGLKAIAVNAETGPIGGDYSHEFHVIAQTGESNIYYDELLEQEKNYLQRKSVYACSEEKHNPANCNVPAERLKIKKGIEVGHIFYIGTKYSVSMNAQIMDKAGKLAPVEMGCYGIGISRLVGAIIEANHDERGIIWPWQVAPFQVSIINVNVACEISNKAAFDLYTSLQNMAIRVILDDRDQSAGNKFATHDLIGSPWQIIISLKNLELGRIEIKKRSSNDIIYMSIEEAINFFADIEIIKL